MQDISNNKIHTSYGTVTIKKAGQSDPYRLYRKKFKKKINKELVKELNSIVRKYHPEYTDEEILKLYKDLSNGGCTYTSVANTIISQLGYNNEIFKDSLGYSLYDEQGNVNYNKLSVDIFAFLYNVVELDIHVYERHIFSKDNFKNECEQFFGRTFSNNDEVIIELSKLGWFAEGLDNEGNYIYENKRCTNKTLTGTFSDIAKELFNVDAPNMSKEKLETLLKFNNIDYKFKYLSVGEKFSDFASIKINNYKKWLNRFFRANNIELDIDVIEIDSKMVSYEDFVNNINLAIQEGYSIEISIDPGEPVWIKDESMLGWSKPNSISTGHRTNFESFDEEGNILVSSWGRTCMLPKDFYNYVTLSGIKISNVSKDISKERKSK